ncbi:helix-turn-helix domain-containing protein [Nesterenkonia massiliensis]|uniref:helix-turn-helix domain-containing protein n=1 Tax=Nesterenkonia massiliensis TaxID=1232429 RepID=UPI0003FD4A41|nr:helix-turn-helix transcriptional regulator [Nesterenkonia massiliensis]
MTRKLTMRWHLRQLMAAKAMFATTDLVDPLHERGIEISRQMVHRIVTKPPQRINTDLLAALCDILDCTPSDLLELHVEQQRQAPAVNDSGPGIGDLRPVRARVRRPDGTTE